MIATNAGQVAVAAHHLARRARDEADGQAVWSCPPDAGDNPRVEEPGGTGAKKPGTPGRSRSSRSTIAQGMPDVSVNL